MKRIQQMLEELDREITYRAKSITNLDLEIKRLLKEEAALTETKRILEGVFNESGPKKGTETSSTTEQAEASSSSVSDEPFDEDTEFFSGLHGGEERGGESFDLSDLDHDYPEVGESVSGTPPNADDEIDFGLGGD